MSDENWSYIIKPKRKLFDLQIRDIIRYRDLVYLFVKRDFAVQFKQTILGPLWYVINPLVSTIMYSFVFGNLAKIGTDGIPFILFYYSGTMLWTFFTNCFNDASNIFVANGNLFGKVYFPRLTVPISNVFTNVIRILVQFFMLIAFLLWFIFNAKLPVPSWKVIFFPVIFVWLAVIGTGMGIIVSSLTTKYRDLRHLVSFALNLAMYATPVVYPLSRIPKEFRWISYVNPVCAPMELFRKWFFGTGSATAGVVIYSIIISLALLLFGLILFNQNEQNFVDVL
jgi:lipopolysaccharide transport system permease protein